MSEIVNWADMTDIRASSMSTIAAMLSPGMIASGPGEGQPTLRIPPDVYLSHLSDSDVHALCNFLSWFAAWLARRAAALGGSEIRFSGGVDLPIELHKLCCAIEEAGFIKPEQVHEKLAVEALKRRLGGGVDFVNPRGERQGNLPEKLDKAPVVVTRRSRSRSVHPKSFSKKRGR